VNKFRALVLLPAAGAGGLTGVLVGGEGPTAAGDLAQLAAVLLVCVAATIAALVAMWRRAGGGPVWGLSREAWTVLAAAAYLVGLGLAVSG